MDTECTKSCVNDLERAIANEGRLARVEEKVDAINDKLDEGIFGQIKDLDKRIASLERARSCYIGWCMGASAVTGAVVYIVDKVL